MRLGGRLSLSCERCTQSAAAADILAFRSNMAHEKLPKLTMFPNTHELFAEWFEFG
jgi:hypothetical protein